MMPILRGSGESSQECCPHNSPKLVKIATEEACWPREGMHGTTLIELMGMSQEDDEPLARS